MKEHYIHDDRSHKNLVEKISEEFLKNGFETKLEVPLLNGSGAVDICVYEESELLSCIEVKSSPSARMEKKKIKKQILKYKKQFGENIDYCLCHPESMDSSQIKVDQFNKESIFINEYINNLRNHNH